MSGTWEPGIAEAEAAADSSRVAREVIHRFNNFLSLLVARGEAALESKDLASPETALRALLDESRLVEEFLRRSRRSLGE